MIDVCHYKPARDILDEPAAKLFQHARQAA